MSTTDQAPMGRAIQWGTVFFVQPYGLYVVRTHVDPSHYQAGEVLPLVRAGIDRPGGVWQGRPIGRVALHPGGLIDMDELCALVRKNHAA